MQVFVRLWVLSVSAVVSGAAASALEVPLTVVETENVARRPAVITTGVPFARGAVKDVSRLAVSADGRPVPAQFIRTAPWDDGSVRWALMDVQVPVAAGGKVRLVVTDRGARPDPPSPVKIEERPDSVRVSTGPLRFAVSKRKSNLFESIEVDGRELLTGSGRGPVIRTADGKQVTAGAPDEVTVEQAGPLRAVLRVRGRFAGIHRGLVGYTARITAFAGRRFVKVHLWLENHGAMGYWRRRKEEAGGGKLEWFPFDGMGVELALRLGGNVHARCEGVEADGRLKVYQYSLMARSQQKERYKKPPFYTWNDLEYTITSGKKVLKRGRRTDGVVSLRGPAGTLTAAVRDFWQNYEKAVELDGSTLTLWLWPVEGQWPRPGPRLHSGELFDRDLQGLAKEGLYYLPGSVEKGHEFILDFSGRPPAAVRATLSAPLMALASAEYYASTEAAPGLFAPPDARTGDDECDLKLDAWMNMTRSAADPRSPAGILSARRRSWAGPVGYFYDSAYWFGWMDFGDLSVPGRGPVSLHYDWTWLMLVNALRTGEMRFFRLAVPMARHRIDVDQLWSDRDPPEVNGLQRGDFNFPAFHCYRLYSPPGVHTNWLEGVVLYYMLTGEPKALECSRRNAEGLVRAWAYIARTKPWEGPQQDMAANAWSISSYCAMYKLTGRKRWLDLALGLFRTNVVAKWKAYGPHLHDPRRQIRSQSYVKDDIKYCYSIRSLCELHHLTGDELLFKLLTEGCEKEFPETFFNAPLFLADLFAYVGWKANREDFVERSRDLFVESFPESKSPPVFLPGDSRWSRKSAMMLRTGHLLQYVHWKLQSSRAR